MSRSVYLAFTPYHIVLTLIHSERSRDDVVVFIDDQGHHKDYKQIGRELFEHFFYINMREGRPSVLARQLLVSAGNRGRIDCFIKSLMSVATGKVYVFNDMVPAGQYIIRQLAAPVVYIEDGSAAYNNHRVTWPLRKRFARRIAYGFDFRFINVIGTSDLVSESQFLFPEHARSENKVKPHQHFERKPDCLARLKYFSGLFPAMNSISSTDCANKSALLLVPYLASASGSFIERLSGIIDKLNEKDWVVFLKMHPEDGRQTNKIVRREVCTVLPGNMPAELVPAAVRSLKLVIGRQTSALLAIKWLFPNLSVVNLKEPHEMLTPDEMVMSAIGIEMVIHEAFASTALAL
jgi:hypothetical protein